MYFYRVYTLFDITATNSIRHPKPNDVNYTELLFKRNQQRNWETLQQVLSMRAQIYIDQPPQRIETCAVFGKKTRAWGFKFGVEQSDVYGPELSLLLGDCNRIPMILGLNEKAAIPSAQLDCYSKFKNLHIEFVDNSTVNTV